MHPVGHTPAVGHMLHPAESLDSRPLSHRSGPAGSLVDRTVGRRSSYSACLHMRSAVESLDCQRLGHKLLLAGSLGRSLDCLIAVRTPCLVGSSVVPSLVHSLAECSAEIQAAGHSLVAVH